MAHGRCLLVLGGARSGKSHYAEARAEAAGERLCYIATAEAYDAEMADRIARHRTRRGEGWTTVEAPLELPAAIADTAGDGIVLLVDCLTLWLSNLILAERDPDAETERLLRAVRLAGGTTILVSNEVGLGIVPDNALARRFRDAAGLANQRVAGIADEVVLVTAGLPLTLKGGAGDIPK
jgi:adenosylcobinamide kinase / adenosylcobinamide-phosphate guanylyltransferase